MENKKNNVEIDINKAISVCLKNNTKCYPIVLSKGLGFKIEVSIKDKIYTFDKRLKNNKEAIIAQEKTYIFYAKKYIKAEEEKELQKTEPPLTSKNNSKKKG